MKKLTKRQQDMLGYIENYISEYRYSPSVRDIASHFSLASAGGVHKHLKNLEQKGFITVGKNISRSIRICDTADQKLQKPYISDLNTTEGIIDLPLKGKVAAGVPISYHLDGESIPFPVSMVKKPEQTYVLEVAGDSMIEEHICDGDFVLVEERNYADNGETVVAMLNYEEATLKKFFNEGQRIRLQPSNFDMDPIYVNPQELSIQGVVVGVIRQY
ncbi:MAG: transcriptional repressor LexA [Proteobacteria bacterium]|nr:transcriptional repressor LexA [Pseudomonadota bacterium]